MNKVIIFVRVSTESQDLVQQRDALQQEAVRLGYPIKNQIVIEHKESAISLKEAERLGIEELKSAISQDSTIDCLICWELSRIGRRADVIISVRDFLLQHKIRWIVLTPYMELIDKNGEQNQMSSLLLGVFTSFAESEMKIKKERAKRGIEYKKNLGKHYGGKILTGYAVNKEGNYVPHPQDSQMMQKIFRMYATGDWSLRALARELKAEGYFPRAEIHSIPTIISSQLRDRRYIGEVNGYPAIINKKLFERCQEISRKHNILEKTVNTHEMLCKGIIFSGVTGYALIPIPAKEQYQSHPDYGKSVGILSKYIDPLVIEFTERMTKAHLMNPEQLKQDIVHSIRQLRKKIQQAAIDQKKTQERIDRVEERYIRGYISRERADELSEELRKNLNYYIQLRYGYDAELEELGDRWENMKEIDFSRLSFEEKRYWVKKVIKKIYVSKPKPLARTNHIVIECLIDGKTYEYDISSHNKKKLH